MQTLCFLPETGVYLSFLLRSAEDHNRLGSGNCRNAAGGECIKDKKKMAAWVVKEGLTVGKDNRCLALVGQAQLQSL